VAAVVPLLVFSVLWLGETSWRGLLVVTVISALAAVWLASTRFALTPARRAAFVCVAGLALAVTFAALHRLPAPNANRAISSVPVPAIGPDEQSSRIWAYRNRLEPFMRPDYRAEGEKLPYVAGLLVVVACAFAAGTTATRSARP
jgi:hypothetical protein